MTDLEQTAQREGWKLVTTIDNGTTRLYLDVVGVSMTDRQALQLVIEKAKTNSKVHLDALRQVAQSRMPAPKRKGKR